MEGSWSPSSVAQMSRRLEPKDSSRVVVGLRATRACICVMLLGAVFGFDIILSSATPDLEVAEEGAHELTHHNSLIDETTSGAPPPVPVMEAMAGARARAYRPRACDATTCRSERPRESWCRRPIAVAVGRDHREARIFTFSTPSCDPIRVWCAAVRTRVLGRPLEWRLATMSARGRRGGAADPDPRWRSSRSSSCSRRRRGSRRRASGAARPCSSCSDDEDRHATCDENRWSTRAESKWAK